MGATTENLATTPSREVFLKLSEEEKASGSKVPAVPIFLRFPQGLLDPPTVFQRIREGKDSFLLESVKGSDRIGRYSIIGTRPFRVFSSKGSKIRIREGIYERKIDGNPFIELKRLMEETPVVRTPGAPPFTGGAVGLISYDAVHFFEKLPRTAVDDLAIPDLHFLFVDTCILFDHVEKEVILVHIPLLRHSPSETSARIRAYEEGVERLKGLYRKIMDGEALPSLKRQRSSRSFPVLPNMAKENYMEMVRRAKAYIKAGDIFQTNLSQRLTAEIGDLDSFHLYRILREINPSPFAAYLDFQEFQIVSSSPERLMLLKDGVVETRPIAGTRPRGKDPAGDQAMSAELITNEKERAEHIMLIDLERNDIGRVCDYGTVRVDELMVLEDYSHVIHIVSNVRGNLHAGKDLFDLIRATFPGGTITGVPKVRCMEIIDELEPVQRGPYTGSIGWLGFNGDMDLNIIIRTFVIKAGKAHVQVGAGIVADSDPEREYFETLHKANALLQTLETV
ncbi:MAG: anthranilate synthase component I family protein [Deltaproteobacteria bacterium]|nr:anthranilate synthase component I family protein [Deltaproteobacteria bacterium]